VKVGDLVRVKEEWKQACEEVNFNDSNAWSDEFMEKVP
jgi:hypothetical protein